MRRFDMGGAITTATPGIFIITSSSDNAVYYNQDGGVPAADHWLQEFTVTASNPCKIEFGLTNSGKTGFQPIYTTYATAAVAGGIVKDIKESSLPVPIATNALSGGNNLTLLALRITVFANATVFAGGDVRISKQ